MGLVIFIIYSFSLQLNPRYNGQLFTSAPLNRSPRVFLYYWLTRLTGSRDTIYIWSNSTHSFEPRTSKLLFILYIITDRARRLPFRQNYSILLSSVFILLSASTLLNRSIVTDSARDIIYIVLRLCYTYWLLTEVYWLIEFARSLIYTWPLYLRFKQRIDRIQLVNDYYTTRVTMWCILTHAAIIINTQLYRVKCHF